MPKNLTGNVLWMVRDFAFVSRTGCNFNVTNNL